MNKTIIATMAGAVGAAGVTFGLVDQHQADQIVTLITVIAPVAVGAEALIQHGKITSNVSQDVANVKATGLIPDAEALLQTIEGLFKKHAPTTIVNVNPAASSPVDSKPSNQPPDGAFARVEAARTSGTPDPTPPSAAA